MTALFNPQAPQISQALIDWLLDSDPAIRWQVRRDLLDSPEDEVAAERTKVATEGWGAELLALQGKDGKWPGGWDATMRTLTLLREFGLDPPSEPARRAIELVRERVIWEGWDTRFFGRRERALHQRTGWSVRRVLRAGD